MKKLNSFYPSLGMSWTLIAVFFAGNFATGALLTALPSSMATPLELATNPWATLVSYILPFLFAAGFIYLLQRNAPAAEATAPTKKPLPFVIFPLLLLFMPLVGFVTEPLTAWMPMPDFFKQLFASMTQQNLPTFLLAVVAAPVLEEWLCRGVIAKGLLRHSTPARAILWSAFIFAFIHLNPWQAVPAFTIGAIIGYVYWKTGSLAPCIFIHFINNGWAFLLSYLYPELAADATGKDLLGDSYGAVYAGALPAAAGIGFLLYRILNKKADKGSADTPH